MRFLGDKGVSELRSVKARKAAGLSSMGIESVLDLLMHYPRRYIDRRHQSEIGALAEDEEAMVTATVSRVSLRRTNRGKTMVQVVVEDATARLMLVFFNQPWRAHQLTVGSEVVVFGRTEIYRGARQMTKPVVDLVGDQTGRRVPVYPQSGKAKIGSPRSPRTWPRPSSAPGALQRCCRNSSSTSWAWSDVRRRSERYTPP